MTEQTPPEPPDNEAEKAAAEKAAAETAAAAAAQEPPKGDQTFKTFEDAMTGYKSVQGAYTKETQETKRLREELVQAQEQIQIMNLNQPAQQQPAPQAQDFDTRYIENPEGAIDTKVAEGVKAAGIQEALDELYLDDADNFQNRYNYANALKTQYPQLTTSKAGIKKLFELGDKKRVEDMKRNAEESVNLLFGDNVDMDKLKGLIQKDPGQQSNINNAYMPDTTQSTGPTPDLDSDTVIAKAVQEGDVDTVIEETFKKALK